MTTPEPISVSATVLAQLFLHLESLQVDIDAFLRSLDIKPEPERIERVNQIGEAVRVELRRLGFNIGNSQTPIVPILIGDDTRTLLTWKALFDAGVFVNPVLPPAVPEDQQLLRTSYMATHTDEQIDRVLELYEKVGREMEI